MSAVTIRKQNKPFISARDFPSWQQQNIEMKRTYEAFQSMLAMDSFSNPSARIGLGTNNLLEGTQYPLTRLTRNYLLMQSLYRDNWIVQKVIKSVADDLLKNWIKVVTDLPPKQIQRFNNAIDDTLSVDKLREAMYWGRLYGGAAAVIIIKGHGKKLDKPLNFDDVEPGSYMGLIPLDRWAGITPSAKINTDINDPINFGLPESYRITTESASSYDVHSSRVLRFIGRRLPNWERQAETYWGESEVEVFYEELKKRDNTSWNLASLIFRANILSIRQKDLSQMLSGLGMNQNALKNFTSAMRAITDLMSNQGMLVLPEEGGMEQHSYSFSGIAEVYEQFKQDICGATEYPYSRLFGKPSGGMGNTNEGDEHTYYDNVAAKQKADVDPQLKKLLPVVAMSVWGEIPKDFSWIWNPVRSLSNEEQAEMGSKKTTSIIEAFNANVITQRVAAKELKQQAEESNLFSNIDDDMIEKTDDDFTNPADEMGGMGMPPLGGPEDTSEGGPESEPEDDEEEVGKKVKRGKKNAKKVGSEQETKKGPSKSGGGEIPKVQTSKPKRGKDSLEGFLARIKNSYRFGGELAEIHKQHDNGTYTLRIKGKDFLADRECFDFVDSSSLPHKRSKADVDYESPGTGKDHCRDCVHYLPDLTQCQVVEGTDIYPKDWCDEFELGVAQQVIDAAKAFKKKLASFSESDPKTKAAVRSDPRQKSLYGEGHTKELQEYYRKAKDEDKDTERHLRFNGLDVMIENEVGSIRHHARGEQIITVPYGYILGTEGVDGDRVDVFVGPNESARYVFVVHILDPETGKADEDKCFIGFNSVPEVKKAFLENYGNDERFFDSMDKLEFEDFVEKLRSSQGKKITDSEYSLAMQLHKLPENENLVYNGIRIHKERGSREYKMGFYLVRRKDGLSKQAGSAAYAAQLAYRLAEEPDLSNQATDDWNEQDHPRGQEGTGKGGQFVKKGESGGTPAAKPEAAPRKHQQEAAEAVARFKRRIEKGRRRPEELDNWLNLHYGWKTELPEFKKEAVAQFHGKEPGKSNDPEREQKVAQVIARFENWANEERVSRNRNQLEYFLAQKGIPEDVRKEAISQFEKQNPAEKPKAANAEEIKRALRNPEVINKVMAAYEKNRKMGSIASIAGLARGKPARAALRGMLRKAGMYKENGGWVKAKIQPGQLDAGFGEAMIKKIGEIENRLKTSPITSESRLGGGCNVTKIVHFADGRKGVFKPHAGEARNLRPGYITHGKQTEREVGAWEVAKIVGMQDMVTPCIDREYNGQRGAVLEFKPGKVANKVSNAFDGSEDRRRMAVFDFVIGNTDRHQGNWLVSDDKIHLIDHGLAFPEKNGIQRNAALAKVATEYRINGPKSTDDAPAKYAKLYIENKDKLIETVRGLGLSDGAVKSMRERIGQLAEAKNWSELQDSIGRGF
jgi:phage-related protein (TIGR01555 family)